MNPCTPGRMTPAWSCRTAASLLALFSVALAAADVPRKMAYQGRLTGNGTGPVNIEVRLYDAETGGNLLWSEAHPDVAQTDGLFAINIGSETTGGIPDATLLSGEVWLGIAVNGGPELEPRQQLLSVPFSANTRGLFVDVSANIGIGTETPEALLDVQGTIALGTANGVDHRGLSIRGPNDAGHDASYRDIAYKFQDAGEAVIRAWRGSEWDTYLQFLTSDWNAGPDNPQPRMTLDSIGLGVGTTLPEAPLHVTAPDDRWAIQVSPSDFNAAPLRIRVDDPIGGSGAWNYSIDVGYPHTNGWLSGHRLNLIRFFNGNTIFATGRYGSSLGNVGIGTVSPKAKLDVAGTVRMEVAQIRGADLAERFPVKVDLDCSNQAPYPQAVFHLNAPRQETAYECSQGAIIGKAMTPLTEGRGLVLVLVNLQ